MSRLLQRTAGRAAGHAGMGGLAGPASGAQASLTAAGRHLDSGAAAPLRDVLGPLGDASAPVRVEGEVPTRVEGEVPPAPAGDGWICYSLVQGDGGAPLETAAGRQAGAAAAAAADDDDDTE